MKSSATASSRSSRAKMIIDTLFSACDAVERYGGRKAETKDGVVQFDMKDACGIQGNNISFYKSGKISVTSTEKGKADAPPKFDFCKTVLIDVIDDMSSVGRNGFLELNSTQLESKLIFDIFNSTQLKSIVEIFESTQLI